MDPSWFDRDIVEGGTSPSKAIRQLISARKQGDSYDKLTEEVFRTYQE